MQKSPKTDCYILGTAYCGSTLLGSALNRHPQIAYVGELSRAKSYNDKYCLYNSSAQCMQCMIGDKQCDFITKRFIEKTSAMSPPEAHDYLRKSFKKPIIVDGSKYPSWLRIAAESKNFSTSAKVIIVSRSPSSHLASCSSRKIEPLWVEANAWRDTYYDAIRTVNQLGLSCMVVRHEDYISNPAEILTRICEYLGVKYKKSMTTASNTQLHAIGGNPGAYLGPDNRKDILERAKSLGQVDFDINPCRLKNKLFFAVKNKPEQARLRQIAFESPGLADVATQLGYQYKDF